MQNNDKDIQDFFKKHRGDLDTERMSPEHEARFLEKMKAPEKKTKKLWVTYLSIAASIILLIGFYLFNNPEEQMIEENDYPQEIAEAQFYFEGIITRELDRIQTYKNESNAKIIEDTLERIQKLKTEEEALLNQLSTDYNRGIVKALVDNFQLRINLLNDLVQQIDEINQLKNEYNEINL